MTKIEQFARNIARKGLSRLPPQLCKRLLANSLLLHEFDGFIEAPKFKDIMGTWDFSINLIGEDAPIIFIEFGVFNGRSIRYFSERFKNTESLLLGLDTFEGLPEAWDTQGNTLPKGTFSTDGKLPDIKDKRVCFFKGLFQETVSQWMNILLDHNDKVLIAHFDADLYSSTLFGLTKIAATGKQFYCIFDEFYGDECRAFSDFKSAYHYNSQLLASGARGYSNGEVSQRNALFLVSPKVA